MNYLKITKNKTKKIYLFLRKNWFIPLFITGLPSGIPSILGVLGDIEWLKWLYYIEGGVRYLNPDYAKVFFVCWAFSVAFTCLWHWGTNSDGREETKRLYTYKKLCEYMKLHSKLYSKTIMSIVNDKKTIYKKKIKNAEESLKNTSSRFNPSFRLEKVFANIRNMISDTCAVEKEKISITLICKQGEKGKWRVLQSENPSPYEDDLDFIMSKDKSTYNAALKIKSGMIFYPDKNEAEKNGQYVPNQKEKSGKLEGSIFCKNLSIYKKNNKIKYGFVLAISTRNVKIADPEDEYSINMCKEILNFAVSMIEPEISIMCLNKYLLEGK